MNKINYDIREINSLEKLKEALKVEMIKKFENRMEWVDHFMSDYNKKDSMKWNHHDMMSFYYKCFYREVMGKDIMIDLLFDYLGQNTVDNWYELNRDAERWRMLMRAIKEDNIVQDILEVTEP